MINRSSARQLQYVVYAVALVITLACLMMTTLMREGLPVDGSTVLSRMIFIDQNTALWSASWCVWMFAAIGLYLFCAVFASQLNPSVFRTVGLALVGMGIPADLSAEVIYAFIIPKQIALDAGPDLIIFLEQLASHLTGFLGNGLYNLGGLMLTLLAFSQKKLPVWLFAPGILAWLLGLALSASIAVDAMKAAEIFTALSMTLSTLWMVVWAKTRLAD